MSEDGEPDLAGDYKDAHKLIVDLCENKLADGINEQLLGDLHHLLEQIARLRKELKGSRDSFELFQLDRKFARDLSIKVVPALCDCVYDTVPIPGELSGAEDGLAMKIMIEITWIYDNEKALCGNPLSQIPKLDLATKLSDAAQAYHRRQKDQLDFGKRPDLANLSIDQLRLDVLIWFIEMLGSDSALKSIRTQAFATARAAIDATTKRIDIYVKRRTANDQQDLAALLNNVEDLIDLTNRIIEEDERTRQEEEDIILALGEKSISGLVESLGVAILAIFQELERHLDDGTATPEIFQAHLEKAEHIHRFCSVLDDAFGQRVYTAVRKAITEKTKQIVAKLVKGQSKDSAAHTGKKLRIVEKFLASVTSHAMG